MFIRRALVLGLAILWLWPASSAWTFSGINADGKCIEAQGADLLALGDGKIVVKQAFRKDRPLKNARRDICRVH